MDTAKHAAGRRAESVEPSTSAANYVVGEDGRLAVRRRSDEPFALRPGTTLAVAHRVIKLAAPTVFVLACASSPIDVTGSFDPPYITQPFIATSGMFDTVIAPTRLGSSDRTAFTELYFTNGSDPCGQPGSSASAFLAVRAAIYTSTTAESPIDGAIDFSVHGPGVFPLSPPRSNDGRADASWEFDGTHVVDDNFTAGAIRVTAVSDDSLSGEIAVQTSDPQLAPSSGGFANGSFTVLRCTAPYVTSE
jgi:hypothetical protein